MGKIKCLNCGTELTMISNAACPACGRRLSHVKISFLSYLGYEDSVAGFQRSYKLVFLKSVFEECLIENPPKIANVTDRFKSYYIRRKLHGLPLDKDVDSGIADIADSSAEDAFEVILKKTYNAICKQGYLKADERNGVFVLQRGIDDFSEVENKRLLQLLQEKLKLYYNKIGSEALPEKLVSDNIPQGTAGTHFLSSISKIKYDGKTIPECTLEDLDLSNRIYNALKRNGVHTAEEMIEAVSAGKLGYFKGIGAATVDELERVVERLKNGIFIPRNLSTDSIDSVYSENSFNSFRKYCRNHNILTVTDLVKFDFNLLLSTEGFDAVQIKLAKRRYLDYVQNLESAVQADVPAESAAKRVLETVHESNLRLPISTLRFFGYTPKALKTLQEAGISTFLDLQKAGFEAIVNNIGKRKSEELCEILKIFTESIYKIGAKVLDKCAKDYDFKIFIQRIGGDTLQTVADTFGLTRERIRQICLKFEHRIIPFMHAIAETILADNKTAYFTESQILNVFDNDSYNDIIVFILKKCSEYTYLDFAQTFVRNKDFPNAEDELQRIAAEIVGDGINLFDKIDEIESVLSIAGYGFVTADGFFDLLIKYDYKFFGDYVVKTRNFSGRLCAEIVADIFPDGIHINDNSEINRLKMALEAKYGKLGVPKSNRSLINIIIPFLVLSGKSAYIAPENIIVDNEVLLDVKSYIDDLSQQEISYKQLFSEFEGILSMTSNIDNPSFLHGVLAKHFPDDYIYDRNFLRKLDAIETASLTEQIKNILVEAGHPLTRKQITTRLSGLTDMIFNNIFQSSPWLIQWEYGVYNCSDNFSISTSDSLKLRSIIESLLLQNDGYCSQNLLYKHTVKEFREVFIKNHIKSAQNVFCIASYLFADEFLFNRSHIALKGRFPALDGKTIALELLKNPTILNADDFFAFARKVEWSEMTASLVFSDIEKEYMRLNKNMYLKSENFELTDRDLEYVSELLKQTASDEWYLPLQRFAYSEDCTPDGFCINAFIINTITSKYDLGWHVVAPRTKDRRYEKGILVRNEKKITEYDQLVAQVLADAGMDTLSTSKMLSFLRIHQLIYKTIPKELEVSEYFIVSDNKYSLA